jgi:hypothetical protein
VVNVAADLAQFVQRRELLAYEQRVARAAYAYGVDLRRTTWLDHSTLGEPLMRSVDRRWSSLVDGLAADVLEPADRAAPSEVMEELARLLRLLRAPLPTLRLLRSSVSDDAWPIATPLGTTRGGSHWLVLDIERLMGLDSIARTFILGSALGDLQCDHGPLFSAHLMAHRGRGQGLVTTLLAPWSRVSVFSADRAGLLAVGELVPTLEALRLHGESDVGWLPRIPAAEVRVQALEDFDKSRVMTRLRLMFKSHADWTVAPPPRLEPDAQPEAQEDDDPAPSRANVPDGTREAAANDGGPGLDPPHPSEKRKPPPPPEVPDHEDASFEDVVEQAEREAEDIVAGAEAAEAAQDEAAREQAIADALRLAWPLARCDARLTRRLGLL